MFLYVCVCVSERMGGTGYPGIARVSLPLGGIVVCDVYCIQQYWYCVCHTVFHHFCVHVVPVVQIIMCCCCKCLSTATGGTTVRTPDKERIHTAGSAAG